METTTTGDPNYVPTHDTTLEVEEISYENDKYDEEEDRYDLSHALCFKLYYAKAKKNMSTF